MGNAPQDFGTQDTFMTGNLPLKLRPNQTSRLMRLGGARDGGYLVNEHDVLASDGLISMGIDSDWQFERDFTRMKGVPVHAYDGCTSTAYLLQHTWRALAQHNWRWVVRSVLTVVDYYWFFSRPANRHFRQFVGTNEHAYQATGSHTVEVADVFTSMLNEGSAKVFLKIDIEGAEYRMLDELMDRALTTTGLAIEFHDCDEQMGEIVEFVEGYPLTLVHVHANPYGGVGRGSIPRALELTFSSSALRSELDPILPHPLDAANNGDAEIFIEFA